MKSANKCMVALMFAAVTAYACNNTGSQFCETATSGTNSAGYSYTTTNGQTYDTCDSIDGLMLTGNAACSDEPSFYCSWSVTTDYSTGAHTAAQTSSTPTKPTYASGDFCWGLE